MLLRHETGVKVSVVCDMRLVQRLVLLRNETDVKVSVVAT